MFTGARQPEGTLPGRTVDHKGNQMGRKNTYARLITINKMVNIISARAYGFGNDLNSYPVDETKQLFGQLKRNNQFLNRMAEKYWRIGNDGELKCASHNTKEAKQLIAQHKLTLANNKIRRRRESEVTFDLSWSLQDLQNMCEMAEEEFEENMDEQSICEDCCDKDTETGNWIFDGQGKRGFKPDKFLANVEDDPKVILTALKKAFGIQKKWFTTYIALCPQGKKRWISSFSILSRIVTAALKNGITTQETLDKFDFKRAIVSNKALEFKDGEFKRLFTHDILLEKVQSRL